MLFLVSGGVVDGNFSQSDRQAGYIQLILQIVCIYENYL